MGFFGSIGGIGGSYPFVRNAEKRAQSVAQSSPSNQESVDSSDISEMQRRTLTSFLNVVKDIAWKHGISAFANDDKLFEACAELEGGTYRCGRDLLLTVFMKKIPQQFARERLTSGKISWDADTQDVLTEELGMNLVFATRVLGILRAQLEECKKG